MKLRLIVTIAVIAGSLSGLLAWRLVNDSTRPRPVPTTTATTLVAGSTLAEPTVTEPNQPPPERLAYLVTRPGTSLRPASGAAGEPVAGGIVLPILYETADGFGVFDTCNQEGWVAAGDADEGMVPNAEADGRFDRATFVIDPGHGLPDYGAVGPTGLTETEANLAVARRVVDLLRRSNDIDWTTGAVTPGSEVPAAAAAVLTRGPDGPNGGDYQLGLTYRATVGNSLDADALVSIHHNTVPEADLDHPGSDAFVSLANPESPRLGGLIVQELRAELSRFDADWMGSPGAGLVSRVGADGEDYYSILARSRVPAAIIEGVYISNPSEEALAKTDEFRQAYADAVYRALVRFITTDDDPIPPPEPQLWEVDRPPPSLSECQVPGLDG